MHTYTYIVTYICLYTHRHIHISYTLHDTFTCLRTHWHINGTHMYTHTCVHIDTRMPTHLLIHTYMSTHSDTCTCLRTHTQTHWHSLPLILSHTAAPASRQSPQALSDFYLCPPIKTRGQSNAISVLWCNVYLRIYMH